MPRDYKVKSVIICDDVRRETNGKEILIGVYNDTLLFSDVPALMGKVSFRVALWSEKVLKRFNIRIEDPNKNKVIEAQGEVPNAPNPKSDPHRVVGITCGNLPFSVVGTYRILFGADHKLEPSCEFIVRTPQTDEEKKRLTET